jgi:hypothetical protein
METKQYGNSVFEWMVAVYFNRMRGCSSKDIEYILVWGGGHERVMLCKNQPYYCYFCEAGRLLATAEAT